jgi:hypothetical protein
MAFIDKRPENKLAGINQMNLPVATENRGTVCLPFQKKHLNLPEFQALI